MDLNDLNIIIEKLEKIKRLYEEIKELQKGTKETKETKEIYPCRWIPYYPYPYTGDPVPYYTITGTLDETGNKKVYEYYINYREVNK